ncbi:AAA family ATPase [Oleisolibacter albus]|uniref:AAA family ATPase n=1 Tax=Oleisolibacter albus TaxID=2171757 RepID=UPI000DF2359A|nr:AAA family ATPase [Oleisolibacter albus]
MRILAVRGENLASLAGPFALDLAAGPLATAGLFAITGPTGAGKSTLLDALCLPLFNAMPRLPAGTAVFGRDGDPDQISIADPRGILRRGAAAGFAEVDFLGIDGGRYRARWSVRRARDRADGRLQPVRMALMQAADGLVLAEGTTAVLAAVEEKLGLNFAQFRRTVLLAQGDFAGFLKAKGNERAEILARLTGTGIYARISRLAYQRASAERERLRQIEEGLGQITLPTPEQEAEIASALAAARAGTAALEQAVQALGRDLAWHDQAAALAARVAAQTQILADSRAALTALAPEAAQLAAFDQVQPLSVPLAALDRAEAAGAAAARQVQHDRDAVAAARQAAGEAAAQAGAAAAVLAAAETDQAARLPALTAARALDVRLSALADQQQRAGQGLDRLSRALAEARDDLEQRRTVLSRDEAALAAVAGWLDAAAPRRALADGWPRWSELLGRAARTRQALRRTELEREQAQAARDEAARPVLDWRSTALEADLARQQADRTLASLPPAPDAATATAARLAAAGRLEDLRQAQETAKALAGAADTLAAVDAAEAALDRQAADRAARLPALALDLAGAQGELRGLRRLLDVFAAADGRDAADLRATLAEGAPCPVCGSLDHPYRQPQPPRDPRRDALGREQEHLDGRIAALLTERAGIEAADRAAGEDRRRLAADRARAQQLRAEAGPRWAALRPRLPRDCAADAGDITAALLDRLAQAVTVATHDLARGQEREAAALAADRQRAALVAALAEAGTAHGKALAGLAAAEAKHMAAAARVDGLQAEMERLRAEAAEQGRDLAGGLAPVSGWEARLAADPTALAAELDGWVEQYAARRQAQSDLAGRLSLARAGMEEQTRRIAALAADHADAGERAAQLAAEIEALRRQRHDLIGADDPDALEATARDRVETARRRREAADAALARTREALAQAEGNAAAAAQADTAAAAALAAAEESFRPLLALAGRSRAEVAALLALGPDWAAGQRARLDQARRRVEEAGSVLEDRQRQMEAHAAAGRPAQDRAAVLAALEQDRQTLAAAQDRTQTLRLQQQRHEDARAQAARVGQRLLAQQERVQLWGGLAEVIGSANGARFQNYAQALSLDVLLQEANHHLAMLAPRYRLERTRVGNDPGALEIQVVDRDMALEVRSVHSLSGGESFLVSLALALGLSGLVGGGASIGTLFIDEGFGALDPASLDLAIGCLETLQASGRQIGVISHVDALTERLGVQVQVQRTGGGRSCLRLRSPADLLAAP